MTFIYHIIMLGGLCLFGYTSNNGFELLIAGIAGNIFALILSTRFDLSFDISVMFAHVLSLKHEPSENDRKLSRTNNDWINREDWPKLAPKMLILLYSGVSCFLIIKSILEMLLVIGK